ncbi:MAG: DUF1593 domain-containing protein [Opitutaceae bacterium]|nr:DUF1593 domain-containing protein [Opitutaceae bacterium]
MRVLRRFFLLVFVGTATVLKGAPAIATADRPRLIVLSDYFKDPDDKQSMIRLLVYANEFELEGLIATSLAYGDGAVRPELIHEIIDDYAKVYPNLRLHGRPGAGFPAPAALKLLVKAGAPVVRTRGGGRPGFAIPYPPGAHDSRACTPAENWIGAGKDTAASQHIIQVVDRDDPRPVWVAVWGGPMDLAQALWKVRHERPPAALARFVARLRLYQISWQDSGAVWLWENFPDLFRIQSTTVAHGLYAEGPPELRDAAWVQANLTEGHGALGAGYPAANATGKSAVNVKEGDTASFLHLLAPGLTDPEQPTWGGWGGRFQPFDATSRRYIDARDRHPASDDPRRESRWTLARWNEAIANDFAARMDWCVQSRDRANHAPVVRVDGDSSRRVLQRDLVAGETLSLDAASSQDPDGNPIRFHWWQYAEAGSSRETLVLQTASSPRVTFVAPKVSTPQTIHLILSATDDGKPNLTSYRRVIVNLRAP